MIDEDLRELIRLSRELGFNSFKDFCKAYFKEFSYQRYIDELFEDYLYSVQVGRPKWDGSGYWSIEDSFEDYVRADIESGRARLKELEEKKKTRLPSFLGIRPLEQEGILETPFKISEEVTMEDLDFYELLLKKGEEACKLYLQGVLKVSDLTEKQGKELLEKLREESERAKQKLNKVLKDKERKLIL